jgi:hypothetical protein
MVGAITAGGRAGHADPHSFGAARWRIGGITVRGSATVTDPENVGVVTRWGTAKVTRRHRLGRPARHRNGQAADQPASRQ